MSPQVKWGTAYLPEGSAAGLSERALQEIKNKTKLVVLEIYDAKDGFCEVGVAGSEAAVELATHW